MKKILINENDGGQRVDKFLTKFLPALPHSLLYKHLRKKRVKRGGRALKPQDFLRAGDVLELYINDEFFPSVMPPRPAAGAPPVLLYEDKELLVADKPAGQLSHGDAASLLSQLQGYLYQTGAYDPRQEHGFAPALANRLDRNTRGLILAAKTARAKRALDEKLRAGEIVKGYLCVVNGCPARRQARLSHWLLAGQGNRVSAVPAGVPGAKLALLDYEVLRAYEGLSLLRVTLLTGRKHQIRVQLAAVGHPLLGDTKYGAPPDSRSPYQALCADRLHFAFSDCPEPLRGLAGKTLQLEGRLFDFLPEDEPGL